MYSGELVTDCIQAHAHARKAAEETQQIHWSEAAAEHQNAAADFARASRGTSDVEVTLAAQSPLVANRTHCGKGFTRSEAARRTASKARSHHQIPRQARTIRTRGWGHPSYRRSIKQAACSSCLLDARDGNRTQGETNHLRPCCGEDRKSCT